MPTIVLGAGSNATALNLTWSELTTSSDTGNSQILAYEVYWDVGSGTPNVILIKQLTPSYLVQRLVPGQQYSFKVRAQNIYGSGAFSDV
jgi:hypothetical protein